MKPRNRTALTIAASGLLAPAILGSQMAWAAPTVIALKGATPALAVLAAKSASHAAELRAAWLAAGHSVAEAEAADLPAITGGSVTANTITIGTPFGYPELSFTYKAGAPGLSGASFVFSPPGGASTYGAQYSQGGYVRNGTASFDSVIPLSLYAVPGTWTLVQAEIYDLAGNSTVYDAAALAKLFTNTGFTVVNNGLVDSTPPTILKGKLFNDTLSLSAKFPLLKASITSSDSGSGLYEAYIFFQPPGATYYEAQVASLPLPKSRAALPADNVFGSYDPTGTYNIVGYAVCDYAGNCNGSTTDSDVLSLLGTDTFTVTP